MIFYSGYECCTEVSILQMILITSLAKPFLYTEKGSLKRAAVLKLYEAEINDLYNAIEQDSESLPNVKVPSDWSYGNTLQFIRDILRSQALDIPDEDDVFHHGCNSLRVARIENLIRNILKAKTPSAKAEGLRNFVYEHSTPKAMATFVFNIVSMSGLPPSLDSTAHKERMEQLIKHFGAEPRPHETIHTTSRQRRPKAGVLVTGTTGCLGAHIFSTLVQDPTVARIYALNRAHDSTPLLKRQQKSLATRGLDPSLATDRKVILLEGDLEFTGFKLDSTILNEVCLCLCLCDSAVLI